MIISYLTLIICLNKPVTVRITGLERCNDLPTELKAKDIGNTSFRLMSINILKNIFYRKSCK